MSTIAEAVAGGAGKSVRITARVKRAFDGKSGVGTRGQWTRQDFELEDGTGTLKVEWWGNDLGKAQLQGAMVTLQPGPDGKGCYLKEKPAANGRPASLVVSCDGPGKVTLAADMPAQASAASGTITGVSMVPAAGALALTQYLDAAKRVMNFAINDMGILDHVAAAAVVNTAMISITNGRVVVDQQEEPPIENDGWAA